MAAWRSSTDSLSLCLLFSVAVQYHGSLIWEALLGRLESLAVACCLRNENNTTKEAVYISALSNYGDWAGGIDSAHAIEKA